MTSGSRAASRRSKSPSRDAARNASTTAHWPSRSASGTGAPWTRRRPRLASCRVAADDRPTIGAMSSNGIANTSCRTNATRSAGERDSRTASSARPIESPRSASCSGSHAASAPTIGSGTCASSGASRRVRRDAELVQADATDDRGQPGAQVLDVARVGPAEPDPGLLDGVVRLAQRAEHPVGHAAQVRAVRLEALGQPVLVGRRVGHRGPCHIRRSSGFHRS